MPYTKKKRPYKKEYQQQKARGEHADRMERQRARRKIDKEGVDKNKNGKEDILKAIHYLEMILEDYEHAAI